MSTSAEKLFSPGLPPLQLIASRPEVNALLGGYLRGPAVLEAGCGRRWPYKVKKDHTLTGVDVDPAALKLRTDLDRAILGDLRTVEFPPASFDTIYSAFVLEHVSGAETVLRNMVRWLKPGGLLLVNFPDRDSVYGFFTRITPFWFHILYKRYVEGNKNAGKPGHDPYPTVHDKIISRAVFLEFVRNNGLTVVEERGFGGVQPLVAMFTKVVAFLTGGRLSADHCNLMYVLRKGT